MTTTTAFRAGSRRPTEGPRQESDQATMPRRKNRRQRRQRRRLTYVAQTKRSWSEQAQGKESRQSDRAHAYPPVFLPQPPASPLATQHQDPPFSPRSFRSLRERLDLVVRFPFLPPASAAVTPLVLAARRRTPASLARRLNTAGVVVASGPDERDETSAAEMLLRRNGTGDPLTSFSLSATRRRAGLTSLGTGAPPPKAAEFCTRRSARFLALTSPNVLPNRLDEEEEEEEGVSDARRAPVSTEAALAAIAVGNGGAAAWEAKRSVRTTTVDDIGALS